MTKKDKRLIRFRRFLAALALAAIYGLGRFSVREIVLAVWGIFRALTVSRGTVDRVTYFSRLRCCWRCPLFAPALRTCGSPLASNPELGCWCQMERKAAQPGATCWIDDNTEEDYLEYGWKLNSNQ